MQDASERYPEILFKALLGDAFADRVADRGAADGEVEKHGAQDYLSDARLVKTVQLRAFAIL